ncbi:MAG: alpha/beta hydrolase, partial [Flavobacteriaceae bacterium]
NPDRVEKLILIDAAGYPMESESRPIAFTLARIPLLNKALTFITPRSMVRSSVENVYADKSKVSDSLVERYFKLTLRAGNRQALVDRMAMENDMEKADLIKNIDHPTLVLWGQQDKLIPVENAHRFHEDLPNSELVILDNSGHVPMEENPDESVKSLLNFLRVTN